MSTGSINRTPKGRRGNRVQSHLSSKKTLFTTNIIATAKKTIITISVTCNPKNLEYAHSGKIFGFIFPSEYIEKPIRAKTNFFTCPFPIIICYVIPHIKKKEVELGGGN